MKKFNESIKICDKILELYPNNGDVLFDKSCNYAALSEISPCISNLKLAIDVSSKFKINAKKSSMFESLKEQEAFIELMK